ncbi:MAG: amidohydrolase family protein [Planctomycetota bacterium]
MKGIRMNLVGPGCSLILAALFAGPVCSQEQPTEIDADRVPSIQTNGNCIIRDATVLTASHGRLEDTDVLVRAGKIAQIGTDLEAPQGFTVIDAKGKFVIPGIIDCHSHMAIQGGVNEGTQIVTAEVRIRDTVRNDDLTIYRALAGGVTSANLLHGSANAIGGQNAVIKLKYLRPVEEMLIPDAPLGIKFALGENPKQSNWGRGGTRYPATRMGVEVVLRRAFTEAREYLDEWAQYAEDRSRGEMAPEPRRDLRLEAIGKILRGEMLVHCHSYRADEILMLVRLAEEFGFRVATFQHVLEGYKVAPELARHGAGGSTFSDWWAYKFEAYDAIPYNAALMTRAGVNVSLNSDSGELIRRLYHEAAKGIKYGGLSEEEALRLVTLNPAMQLGIDHRTGSIDVGKDADIAIFNGDPLSVYSLCEMTLVEGEVYFERVERRPRFEEPLRKTEDVVADIVTKVAEKPLRDHSAQGPVTVIRGAMIHPVSRPAIERGNVVLRGNRIVAVGDVSIPDGANVIAAEGLHVYPGLIDSGSGVGLTEVGSVQGTIDNRELGDVNPELKTWLALNPDSEIIPVTRVGGITTVLTRPSGSLINGQASLVNLDGWTTEQIVVEPSAALYCQFPNVPVDKKWQDDKRVKELAEWFEKAERYAEIREKAESLGKDVGPSNLRLEALVPFARGEKPVLMSASRAKQMADAIEFAKENGLQIVLEGCDEAWKIADILAENDVPCIVGPVLTSPRERYDPYDAAFFNCAVLEEAGVRFAIQTADDSNSRNLHHHAGMASAFGLPKEAALRAVTLSAAEIFGMADLLGSVDVGKIANLIVTDGDPLEFKTQLHHLIIDGKSVSLESKHTRLYERYLNRLGEEGAIAPQSGASGGPR